MKKLLKLVWFIISTPNITTSSVDVDVPVGKSFKYGKYYYTPYIADDSCEKCIFQNVNCTSVMAVCDSGSRKDKKNVYFDLTEI